MGFKTWNKETKSTFGLQFPKQQREGYRKGKRNGFLEGINADTKTRNKYKAKKK